MGTADDDAAALIHAADQSMYRAKRGGCARVEVSAEDAHAQLPRARQPGLVVELG